MEDRFYPILPPEFRCCTPPFSFYRFIEEYWDGKEAKRTLHRVFSLMRKMEAQTVVVEDLWRKGELDSEACAVEIRCKGNVDFKAWRFSFFSCPVTNESLPYTKDTDYLGYAVLVSLKLPDHTQRRYIYESIIAEPSFFVDRVSQRECGLPNHYIHCVRRYSGWLAGQHFRLSGSFFSQQNGLTHVCAHSALRWLFNNLPERAEEIVSYEDINQNLGIDHVSDKVGQYGSEAPAIGLSMDRLLNVIEQHGYKHFDVDFENPVGRPQPYWRFIYSIIESGYPVLVCFTAHNARHVICAIGHTLNSDIWDAEAKLAYSGAPQAGYLSTASWVDHFVIHDDNYGMYFSMPCKALSQTTSQYGPFQITEALGIVPADIELGPLEAEQIASFSLRSFLLNAPLQECYWLNALREEEASFGKWVVLRTLLVRKAVYQEHLRSMEDVHGNVLKKDEVTTIIHKELPEHFWLTEITLVDLYTANKRKLGEILFKTSDLGISSEDDKETYMKKVFSSCIAIRLPRNIIIPKVTQKDIQAQVYTTDLNGHVPLVRTCGTAPVVEW